MNRWVVGTGLLAVAALMAGCGPEALPPPPPPQPTVEAPPPPPGPPPPAAYAFEGVNFHTGEFQIVPNVTDPQACAKACDDNAQCFVASYHDATVEHEKMRNTCVLRAFIGERFPTPGVSSWIKAGAPQAPPPVVVVERVVVNDRRIQLNEEILFKTGSAEIDPKSDDFVRFIAHILKEHEGLDFTEIAGHTDKTGGTADNVKLSQARADAVVKHLVADGVDPKRLRGVGYGPYCPADPGDSPEALRKNRRVEFVILRRNGHDLPDKWDGCEAAGRAGMKPIAIPASAPKTKEFVIKKARITRKGGELVFSDQVRFEPSTAKIVPTTEPALEALRAFLDANKAITKVRIEGHTDPPNGPGMMALSKARSRKVAEWLVNHGIAPNRVIPVGCGGARPVMKGGHVDERRSRRTEAHVIEEQGKPVSPTAIPSDCVPD